MKERPILFSGPMVRATLDGRKTQTRRVCRDQTASEYKFVTDMKTIPTGSPYTGWSKDCGQSFVLPTKCPYGQPGDRLWVRETFKELRAEFGGIDGHVVNYRAQYTDKTEAWRNGPWKPSIHMPRKYCRLLLDVKAIRVERLQDIRKNKADLAAEAAPDNDRQSYSDAFHDLWDSLNEKRGYGWDTNPWVWVIEFERVR